MPTVENEWIRFVVGVMQSSRDLDSIYRRGRGPAKCGVANIAQMVTDGDATEAFAVAHKLANDRLARNRKGSPFGQRFLCERCDRVARGSGESQAHLTRLGCGV